jgi:hypothetical protein
MRRIAVPILSSFALIAALGLTALAQQTVAPQQQPPAQRGRGAAQQPLRDAAKAAKQGEQQARKPAPDQPKTIQQRRNQLANSVAARYVGGFQKNVGLTDEQTQKFGIVLENYIRRQLMLADRRNDLRAQLKEMTDRQAPADQIQSQYDQVILAENQLEKNNNNFYGNINPQLNPQQRAKLKIYMDETGQALQQAIQKSAQ